MKAIFSDIPNRNKVYFCVIKYFNQFAEGITGASRSLTIFSNGGVGFSTKKAAKEFFKNRKEKHPTHYKNIKGKQGPYGNVGCVDYEISFFKINDLEKYLENYSYYYPTFSKE